MPIDFNALYPQLEALARSHTVCCGTRCWNCRKPLPRQGIRTKDSDGHDVCTFCYEDALDPAAAQEAADAHREALEDR